MAESRSFSKKWLILTILLIGTTSYSDQKIGSVSVSGENRVNLYRNEVTGAGAGSSYLTRNTNFEDQISLYLNWPQGETSRWTSQIQGRFTNDDRVDSKLASLQRLSLERTNPDRTIGLGDFYGSFTQYSLNQNLKGMRWEENSLGELHLQSLFGHVKYRWDDLWTRNSSEQLNRYVVGIQGRRDLPLDSAVGLRAVSSFDDRVKGSTTDKLNQILLSLDWTGPSNSDFSIEGESAWSKARVDHFSTAEENKTDMAHKISARSRVSVWRGQYEFENVGPDFLTTVGAATPDLRRAQTRHQIRFSPELELLLNFTWYVNNLNGQLTDTAQTTSPEGGVRWNSPFDRRSLILEARLRQRQTTHTSSAIGQNVVFSQIISASDRFGFLNVTGEYERRVEERQGSSKDLRNLFGLNFSGFYRWKEVMLRPYFRYNLDHDNDQVLNVNNQVTEISAGLWADITKELSFNFQYQRANVLNATVDSSERDTTHSRLIYNFSKWRGDRVELGYRSGANRFSTTSRDYTESTWETTYVHKF